MITYELTIESSDGDPIVIDDEGIITSAEVAFDTVNDKTQKKSNAILARMTICGNSDTGGKDKDRNKKLNKSLIAISEWARDLENETTYRKVTLTVRTDKGNDVLRTYEIPDMFVCDYVERYEIASADGNDRFKFELKLTQLQNELENVHIY